jgi:large subunit ribosomal protein L17
MRHGRKINHLGRTTAHRHAMLSNMSSSLILHKRVTTTVAKAKALRKYIEPLLTKSKDDTTHSRRMVFAALQDKESIKELFGNISSKIATRPGGYTRILKLSDTRQGDNADMCIIELVDFNETLIESKQAASDKAAAGTTRRSRRGGKKAAGDDAATSATVVTGEAVAPNAVVEQSAPADTATETVKDGESREEAKADEAGA